MHILSLFEKLDEKRLPLEAGDYLVEDVNGAQFLVMAGRGQLNGLQAHYEKILDPDSDYNGKKILIVRTGGFGDLILMTPVFREMKRRWPRCTIHVAAMSLYAAVLRNLPTVDACVDYPVNMVQAETYAAWVFYENAIERNPRSEDIHMTDLFAEIAGLGEIADKKPEIALTDNERIWAMESFPRQIGRPRACFQVVCASQARMYPPDLMAEVAKSLINQNWEVFFVGGPGEIQMPSNEWLKNTTVPGLTFRQSCAVVNNSDVMIGSDSSMVHVAGALGIPAIALYGPFLGSLRTKYCPTTYVLQAKGQCAPCFYHKNGRNVEFPTGPNALCSKTKRCEVLATIKPETIVQKALKYAKKPVQL